MCFICARCAYTLKLYPGSILTMSEIDKYLNQVETLMKVVVGYPVKETRVLLGLRKKVSLGLGENLISGIGGKVCLVRQRQLNQFGLIKMICLKIRCGMITRIGFH